MAQDLTNTRKITHIAILIALLAGCGTELALEPDLTHSPPNDLPPNLVMAAILDDAMIDEAQPTENFGTIQNLEIDGETFQRDFLIRFKVEGIDGREVKRAKLYLYVTEPSGCSGGDYYSVNSNNWSENSVTWETAPAAEELITVQRAISKSIRYGMDISNLVTKDGLYTIRISSSCEDNAIFSSKEVKGQEPYVWVNLVEP